MIKYTLMGLGLLWILQHYAPQYLPVELRPDTPATAKASPPPVVAPMLKDAEENLKNIGLKLLNPR